jgi:hypothetical protein
VRSLLVALPAAEPVQGQINAALIRYRDYLQDSYPVAAGVL